MCTWTNNHNLPERVIRVIQGKYKTDKRPDLGRISITDLIDEPLPRILYINHYDDIVRDYSDLLQATMGQALHTRYETYAGDDDDAEHKFEDAVSVIIVVGKADNYFDNTILDIKTVNVYGPQYKIDKWTKQLNCYAWQRRKRKQEVNKLLIDVWYRNWTLSNIHWKDYPEILYEQIELPLWSFEEQDEYIRARVMEHAIHEVHDNIKDYSTPCSNKARGIRFEAYKNNNKTPTRVGGTIQEVEGDWMDKVYENGGTVNVISSEPVFCIRYCKSRSICPFNPSNKEK